MKTTVHNKVVVITGASSGIGLLVAKELAKKGAIPVLLARSTEKMKAASLEIYQTTGIEASYYTVDVGKDEEIANVFTQIIEKHQKIDVLINNAGYAILILFLMRKERI